MENMFDIWIPNMAVSIDKKLKIFLMIDAQGIILKVNPDFFYIKKLIMIPE